MGLRTTNDTCASCHKLAQTLKKPPALLRTPEGAKPIPHSTDRLGSCLTCHGPSAPQSFTLDHPWATDETCTACHKPAGTLKALSLSSAPPAARPIPHSIDRLESCLTCHGPSAPNAFSKEHPWTTEGTCTACHKQAGSLEPLPLASAPPPDARLIPHAVNQLDNCLGCHGTSGVRPVPQNHPWATNETCTACHKSQPNPVSWALAPVPQASSIRHSIIGLPGCLSCHGQAGSRPYPMDHVGRPDSLCTICHKTAADVSLSAAAVQSGPQMAHPSAGLGDCISCHSQAGPKPYPANHIGRPNGLCLICHQSTSSSAPGATAPLVPAPAPSSSDASTIYILACAGCHGASLQGVIGPPLTLGVLAGKPASQIASAIANGVGSMPGHAAALTPAQIAALVSWLTIGAPLPPSPTPLPGGGGGGGGGGGLTPTPAPGVTPTPAPIDAAALYATSCAGCHGASLQGGVGPALTPSALAGQTVVQITGYITSGLGSMLGYGSMLTPEQISALAGWLTNTAPAPVPTPVLGSTPAPPTTDGAALYLANCSMCHGVNRHGGSGPALTASALSGTSVASITRTITNGTEGMPAYSATLTAGQITAIAQYLKGVTPTPTPTPAPGTTPAPTPAPAIDPASIYATYCAACHGVNRQSGSGPALTTSALASRTVAQISSDIASGPDEMPAYSSVLSSAQISALAQWLKSGTAPAPTATPTPAPTPSVTPPPSPMPTPRPTVTPQPTRTPTPPARSPTPTPRPTPTPTPGGYRERD